ncbi:hypothetical protein B0J12DRAFT_28451 [Macrophomina phaseolina]|uniref:Secreted protein n=1 Tax=Macrophomina phaseolina TaxID=35725 RepID=A0ABQ8GVD4_9PEZI|nr:hypothetical protein B0J12DRAFT_28451 [Macrophomina phaseolina]
MRENRFSWPPRVVSPAAALGCGSALCSPSLLLAKTVAAYRPASILRALHHRSGFPPTAASAAVCICEVVSPAARSLVNHLTPHQTPRPLLLLAAPGPLLARVIAPGCALTAINYSSIRFEACSALGPWPTAAVSAPCASCRPAGTLIWHGPTPLPFLIPSSPAPSRPYARCW